MLPSITELFDLSHTRAEELLQSPKNIYDALPRLKEFIVKLGRELPDEEFSEISPEVWVANDASVSPMATILAPAIIGHHTEVRPGAFIRGSVLVGDGAVIGNSSEIKNALIFDGVQLPHYNYVGDSILGYKAHLGAGAIISNFRLDHGNIRIKADDEAIETGLRKLGALLGDFAEVGCNSVIFPGTVIGRGTLIYPLTSVRGIVPESVIMKNDGSIKKIN